MKQPCLKKGDFIRLLASLKKRDFIRLLAPLKKGWGNFLTEQYWELGIIRKHRK
jgi:hypothetical protein